VALDFNRAMRLRLRAERELSRAERGAEKRRPVRRARLRRDETGQDEFWGDFDSAGASV